MKVNAFNSYEAYGSHASFKRRLKQYEKNLCKNDIENGLKSLNKTMTIILPTNCSPSMATKDVGIGQPYSTSSNIMLYPFLSGWGYTSQQRQPSGLGKPSDASPYVSNSSAYNSAIVDLEKLTTPDMGSILSKKTYKDIVNNNPKKGMGVSSYSYNVHASKKALDEAYKTFITKKDNISSLDETEQKAIKKLDKEFKMFKKTHGQEQEKNALYSILSDIHGNDYWPNWDSTVDKNLYSCHCPLEYRNERISELKENHKDEIESFLFSQMLAKKTLDEGQKTLEQDGIKEIGDIPVAFSDAEVWGNKDLFLSDMRMGCKEPWNNDPQRWGFFVLDPEKLFNNDGTLGDAGKFLYKKYERAFKENKGGVRIDHIVGLMDPYVYDDKNWHHQGRLYSELYPGVNGDNYERILKDIVLKAANEAGLNSSNIIAEDLGYMPNNTKETLNNLGIGGICVTQWMNGHDIWHAPRNNAIMVSNHDTASAAELYPNKDERKNKFIELFSSGAKNLQIFWTDMMGIRERYNMPGKTGDENWSLRLTPDFEDVYYKKLEENDALNIPEVIYEANKRRNPNFDEQNIELASSLKHWASVLKEKE